MNSQSQHTPKFKNNRNLKYLGINKKFNRITNLLRRIVICTNKIKKDGREFENRRELIFTIRCLNL